MLYGYTETNVCGNFHHFGFLNEEFARFLIGINDKIVLRYSEIQILKITTHFFQRVNLQFRNSLLS